MRITLTYVDGTTAVIEPVQSLRLAGHATLWTACFGNTEVRHQGVTGFSVESFAFIPTHITPLEPRS